MKPLLRRWSASAPQHKVKLLALSVIFAALLNGCSPAPEVDLSFASAEDMQQRLSAGQLTSVELVEYYLQQIEANNLQGAELRAMIDINPDAVEIARALDEERANGQTRSPIHGLPVVLKANIATADRLPTTAGANVMAGHLTDEDAALVAQLREHGAIILGKANLSEWANFRGFSSSSGWSGLGGQTRNPYRTSHTPCGSSSGSAVAVAADFTLLAIGTETDGSIMCPASINGVVGVKPTHGSVSGHGIIPIAAAQDIAGPMTRYVHDARLLMQSMITADARADMDAVDPSTQRVVLVNAYNDRFGGVAAMTERLRLYLESQHVEVVQVDSWQLPDGLGEAEFEVLLYEFKRDLSQWLIDFDAPELAADMPAIIRYNEDTAETNLSLFGQEYFELAVAIDLEEAKESYQAALALGRELAADFLDDLLSTNNADAIIVPSYGPAWAIDHEEGDGFNFGTSTAAAVSGYPSVTIRAGYEEELPLGVSLIGSPYTDWRLLDLAERLEQDGMGFVPPRL